MRLPCPFTRAAGSRGGEFLGVNNQLLKKFRTQYECFELLSSEMLGTAQAALTGALWVLLQISGRRTLRLRPIHFANELTDLLALCVLRTVSVCRVHGLALQAMLSDITIQSCKRLSLPPFGRPQQGPSNTDRCQHPTSNQV